MELILVLFIGILIGLIIMHLLQIKKCNDLSEREIECEEIQEDFLYNRIKLIKINDLVDAYRKNDKNIYTIMRDITNIVKGW